MSIIKSFAVGNGDMFYIEHGSANFTMIDCDLDDDNEKRILDELHEIQRRKDIPRFISTHPDDDHIGGLCRLDDRLGIVNFYCVKNAATKEDQTESFKRYCELRDSEKKAFYIFKGCKRRWMNDSDGERGSSGIEILWPDPNNAHFKNALAAANKGESPNNISPIIQYSLEKGPTVIWMGDLETDFMKAIDRAVNFQKTHLLFAPHHGRDSGKVPESMLSSMDPDIIVIGEAPSEHLNYYQGYNTITQNSAGDLVFECTTGAMHIFSSLKYTVEFLGNEGRSRPGFYYVGTHRIGDA